MVATSAFELVGRDAELLRLDEVTGSVSDGAAGVLLSGGSGLIRVRAGS
jgi:hypothetical protein